MEVLVTLQVLLKQSIKNYQACTKVALIPKLLKRISNYKSENVAGILFTVFVLSYFLICLLYTLFSFPRKILFLIKKNYHEIALVMIKKYIKFYFYIYLL